MFSTTDLYRQYHDALEKMNAAVVEYVRGMPVVKVFGATAESFERLKQTVFAFRDFSRKITKDYSTVYPGFLTVISSSLVFIIPVAVFLLSRTESYEKLIPTVLLFMVVGGGMFFPFFKLMFIGNYLKQISVGVERVDAILFREEMDETESDGLPADGSMEYEGVSFAYDETPVLKDVSFKALPNTVTALVGPSGAGKTTMGLLAARFWDVDSGAIRMGGVDIRAMKTKTLMTHVSFVFQDGFLFYDTLEENIRMGNKTASREEIVAAAKAAQCHEFIEKLPNGYDTLVGEGGTYLSGGEQQRIGIARAVLKNSPVVILDEATAFADPENEGKILEALARLIRNKTVIVIAHRLSTITEADQILVVDNGEIVERGNHEALKEADGLYRSMWDTYSRSRKWTIDKQGGR
jgi:ATP-binding cassette subfamily B protein